MVGSINQKLETALATKSHSTWVNGLLIRVFVASASAKIILIKTVDGHSFTCSFSIQSAAILCSVPAAFGLRPTHFTFTFILCLLEEAKRAEKNIQRPPNDHGFLAYQSRESASHCHP
jgi:hypothetical protein